MRSRGFTLIELLVVIAIIGILASIVIGVILSVRPKAYDTRRKEDINSIKNAMAEYYLQYNKYPDNFNCYDGATHVLGTPGCPSGAYSKFGACDQPNSTFPGGTDTNNFPAAYNASMQELVDAKLLSGIPHDPSNSTYCYFDFGPGIPSGATMSTGAIFMTVMQSGTASTQGLPPSCRPWPSNNATWCETTISLEYCLCNTY
jgi:prepilin-type N-terminal cleavage/methylation domain-containing protein